MEDLGQQLPTVGAVSQDYIEIKAGPTGASPDESGLFQALNIATTVRPSLISHHVCATGRRPTDCHVWASLSQPRSCERLLGAAA